MPSTTTAELRRPDDARVGVPLRRYPVAAMEATLPDSEGAVKGIGFEGYVHSRNADGVDKYIIL